ncbi:carboxypeptidase-like regulatory domain-containing protein [Algoriphagus halophytocola]|uniref:Carboxypeptidase-like regulatory domain-containing protein n=1 Tax=Algoriphagus halophytocola TaxID=2991499 RepID=A0ABY6MGE4_9BACT|nr:MULTISPECIES: carboxypeptidase-like regulatory domain-containing protein [unclassified Algoriphagus]UZD22258.1 carboxypeptidase-like regulatory domain-containing protein [Algoriphagus sp. TR-M5]WBL43506.1 carboxypeptidase-like regulatory domain-containing protein [Algoriphagus sp. TR-M9]
MKNSLLINAIFIVVLGVLFIVPQAKAQDAQDKKVIQLSGIILNADSTDAVAGVNIYVPTKGRGTSSGRFGYFSMPVLEGDSVVFSFIGLKRQVFKVPQKVEDDRISLILTMQVDEIALAEVEVMPYPTEEEFKQAVIAMNVVDPMSISRANMSPEMLLRWAESMPASSNENFRYFQQTQMLQNQDLYGPRPLRLLDPFAWGQFIRSIKRGDLKSK